MEHSNFTRNSVGTDPSPTFSLGLAVAVAAAAQFAAAAETKFALPPETAKLKSGPGVELATANCLLCHSADYISTQPRLKRAQWQASVLKMRQTYGAAIAADKVDSLVDYLVKTYGDEAPAGAK
jgi:sulfite dehydrogenase (cytochrome) subunit B